LFVGATRFYALLLHLTPLISPHSRLIHPVICKKLKLSGDFDLPSLAHITPGYVGADLQALAKEAAVVAIRRIFHTLPVLVAPATVDGQPNVLAHPAPPLLGGMTTATARQSISNRLRDIKGPLDEETLSTLWCVAVRNLSAVCVLLSHDLSSRAFRITVGLCRR
jgi:SpoVK/Ycf46/Vps4 family AAA+-type ATPase